jgi:hypothetical protein
MEESKKKPIMIGVIVVCLALALLITFGRRGGGGGIEDISPEEMIWVKCNNPDCKAEYQMSKQAYFKYVEEHIDPVAMVAPPLVCKECGKASCYRAEKCQNPDCGIVFFRGSVPNDFADRCPECGRSETEESRKRRAAGGVGQ